MESWRKVWREGFAPVLATPGLEALWQALRSDDERLIQGAASDPLPLMCQRDLRVARCCSIGWCGWQGEKLDSVGELEEFFSRTCFEADQRLGEPGGCRWFLNWYDDMPRQSMRLELLFEVERTLEQRFLMDHLDRAVRRRRRAPQSIVSAA